MVKIGDVVRVKRCFCQVSPSCKNAVGIVKTVTFNFILNTPRYHIDFVNRHCAIRGKCSYEAGDLELISVNLEYRNDEITTEDRMAW